MIDRELMQQALDALDIFYDEYGWGEKQQKAHEALRARLAQPNEFEPDWDAMAVMVEEQQRMAKRIEELEAQPEPEPVVWADKYDLDREGHDFWVSRQQPAKNGVPLYTAPPQREWQGLTQEDKREIIDETEPEDRGYVMALVEAKLKKKNA